MRLSHAFHLSCVLAVLLSGCASPDRGSVAEVVSTPVQHELNNCYAQITILERQVDLLESSVSSLHDEIAASSQESRSIVQNQTKALDNKVGTLEKRASSLSSDLSTVKNHSNEVASALKECQKQLQKLENANKSNGDNIAALEGAMRSMMAAIQPSGGGRGIAALNRGGAQSYKVRSGDTLEKIARKHNTSIDAIKELNQLRCEDFIIVGQELLIP